MMSLVDAVAQSILSAARRAWRWLESQAVFPPSVSPTQGAIKAKRKACVQSQGGGTRSNTGACVCVWACMCAAPDGRERTGHGGEDGSDRPD